MLPIYAALAVIVVGVVVLVVRARAGRGPTRRQALRDDDQLFALRRDPFGAPPMLDGRGSPFDPPVLDGPRGSPFDPPLDPSTVPVRDEDDPVRREVTALLATGDKIGAIQLFRTRTGAGLRDAKNTVEAWAVPRGTPAATGPLPPRERLDPVPIEARPALLAEVAEVARRDGLIPAIKRWRAATGAGLAASKALVEALAAQGADGVPGDVVLAAWPGSAQAPSTEPGPVHFPPPPERFDPETLTDDQRAAVLAECVVLARGGDKIGAIKLYRARTGAGLKDAKDAVERAAAM